MTAEAGIAGGLATLRHFDLIQRAVGHGQEGCTADECCECLGDT
jgi:hypothetical protein